MWQQFILQNLHFGNYLFLALVFFAGFWLFFDSWKQNKYSWGPYRLGGFLALSFSFLFEASRIEFQTASIPLSLSLEAFAFWSFAVLRIVGYGLIITSLAMEPLQERPTFTGIKKGPPAILILGVPLANLLPILHAPLAALAAALFARRVTKGLERHLRPLILAFALLAAGELLGLNTLLRETSNITLYNLVSPFGPAWILAHLLHLAAGIVLGRWIIGYLLKRFQAQLLMVFISSTVAIFFLTTLTFTFLLLRNLQSTALAQLETDAKVMELSLESQREQALSTAQTVAQNALVQQAVFSGDRSGLASQLESFLIHKNQSLLWGMAVTGQVLVRAEDQSKFGDSLSEDPLFQRGQAGEAVSAFLIKDAVSAPVVSIAAVAPLFSGQTVEGVILAGTLIDNAFVDGIKSATGLETSVFAGETLSATTLTQTEGGPRLIGIKEENPTVKTVVLEQGQTFKGTLEILGVPYLAVYAPIKDVDGVPIGMLFVGEPQTKILEAASRSISSVFMVTVALIIASFAPAYWVAKSIASQIR